MSTLTECLSSQSDALFIAVLGLFSFLEFLMHVTLFLVYGTDKIRALNLLKDYKCLVQVIVSLSLLEELPVLITKASKYDAMMLAFLVLLISINNLGCLYHQVVREFETVQHLVQLGYYHLCPV